MKKSENKKKIPTKKKKSDREQKNNEIFQRNLCLQSVLSVYAKLMLFLLPKNHLVGVLFPKRGKNNL